MADDLFAMGILPRSAPPPRFNPKDSISRYTGEHTPHLNSIALDVSGRCNLACRYCAETASLPERPAMSPAILESAVHFFERNSTSEIRRSVRIGSGEPLLALPFLKRLYALLEDTGDPDVFITTNGTLIDEETADWLASTGWRIKISVDGPAAVHDTVRVGNGGAPTFERVAKAIRLLMERCPDSLSACAVLCRGSDPGRAFEAIASLGMKRIELLPVSFRPIEGGQDLRPSKQDVAAYVAFVNAHAHRVASDPAGTHPSLVRFEQCVRKAMGYGNALVPCGAGRSFVCIGSDGILYPCFRFVGSKKHALGSLEKGIDVAAAQAFRGGIGKISSLRSPCNACWGASLCGGPCFAIAEFFGNDGVPEDLHCIYKLADIRAALAFVDELRVNDPEKLLSFLPVDPEIF